MKYLLLFIFAYANLDAGAKAFNPSKAYIAKYKDLAISCMIESGIPASVILAIALEESANGNSRVCRRLNNHFGVKGRNSGRIRSSYREYANADASYKDFVAVITNKKLYKGLKNSKNTRSWVMAIEKTGYSRVPGTWSKKILSIIAQYKLTQYDK